MNDKISVIMAVYNAEATLEEAINSILNQTYQNFEFIICDDASTDNSYQILQHYAKKDNRIILIQNKQNSKLSFSLNHCLKYATGEYIARMDADDTCSPDRFEKEINILSNNKNIHIVSTDMSLFDETGVWGETDVDANPTKETFLRKTPFCHAPCMVRREAYTAVGGYSTEKNIVRVEDYHLWVKMYAKGYTGVNIKECLYQMRDDRNATKRRKFKYRLNAFYVSCYAIRQLNLPSYNYLRTIKPIVLGLLPEFIYKKLHKMRNKI